MVSPGRGPTVKVELAEDVKIDVGLARTRLSCRST